MARKAVIHQIEPAGTFDPCWVHHEVDGVEVWTEDPADTVGHPPDLFVPYSSIAYIEYRD